eukprot:2287924-Prymnesium_polylepis.1
MRLSRVSASDVPPGRFVCLFVEEDDSGGYFVEEEEEEYFVAEVIRPAIVGALCKKTQFHTVSPTEPRFPARPSRTTH